MTVTRLMNKRGEYRIRAAAENSSVTEILLYDEIGEDPWFGTGVSALSFTEDLQNVSTEEIHLRINSPGGNVFEGITMLNALRRHDAKVTVFVDGLAASAASLVAMGGDQVVMSRNAEMMIHDPWAIAVGNADEMQKMANDLNRASDNLASAYSDKAGGTISQWRKAMRAESWYSDKEAVAAGLADRVEQSKTASDKAKAKFNMTAFAYNGRAAAPTPFLPAEPPDSPTEEGSEMTDTLVKVRQRLGLSADADETAIMAALDTVADGNDPDPDDEEIAAGEPDEDEADEEEADDEVTPGTVSIDEGVLAQLRADAQAGRDARAQQLAERRQTLVNNAVRDGRISRAREKDWLATLEKDPGAETDLAALAKGLVPVDGPTGYTGSLTEVGEDDALYNKLFPAKAV